MPLHLALHVASCVTTGVRVGVLVVSQFTLYADTRKGRRRSWIDAARPEHAHLKVSLVFPVKKPTSICSLGICTYLQERRYGGVAGVS